MAVAITHRHAQLQSVNVKRPHARALVVISESSADVEGIDRDAGDREAFHSFHVNADVSLSSEAGPMEKLERDSPEWNAEWIKLEGLMKRWRDDSNNRELIAQIGVSLEKVGITFDASKHP
jgi:hypothetical protein